MDIVKSTLRVFGVCRIHLCQRRTHVETHPNMGKKCLHLTVRDMYTLQINTQNFRRTLPLMFRFGQKSTPLVNTSSVRGTLPEVPWFPQD